MASAQDLTSPRIVNNHRQPLSVVTRSPEVEAAHQDWHYKIPASLALATTSAACDACFTDNSFRPWAA